MASISGWIYLIVGLAVTLGSRIVSARSEAGFFTILFWIGILFLVVGAFKIVVKMILGVKDEAAKSPSEGVRVRSEAERPAHARDFIQCTRCNAKLNPQSKFCNWCGARV